MTFRFEHLHLRSADCVKAAGFYVAFFGARELSREGASAVTRIVLDLGGLTLFIEQAPEAGPPAKPPNRGIEHIGLAVDDIATTVADLKQRGIGFVFDVTDVKPGLRTAFLDGPDGVRIEILQRG
ncbi:VOC family protein [Methylobacterium sp. 77]|uniref:VOC family protein n=1 Tax=Methylobacterium sp. 77 TaxID=1101192 RepID=UPI0003772558|nr:VOC family protein [Methylobacterium sp. 77]